MEKYFSINKDGHSINVKTYYKDLKNISRAVISCHGFSGNKDNKATERFADHLLKKHKDTVIITYDAPCHGDDVKKILTLPDCLTYLDIIADYVKENYSENIFGYSTSFGAYIMLLYISGHQDLFKGISLRCPAVNMYKVLSSFITSESDKKALSRGKPILAGFDRQQRINQLFIDDLKTNDLFKPDFSFCSENTITIHGTSDEIASFEDSKKFAELNSILFVPVEGADHRFRDPVKMDLAINETIEFFDIFI